VLFNPLKQQVGKCIEKVKAMESTISLNAASLTDSRQIELYQWLHSLAELSSIKLLPMQADASFRRYFRVLTNNGSFVAMDAPPATENCRPFVAVANALRQHGLLAPQIIAAELDHGFLLLTDFGDQTFLKALTPENATSLYHAGLNALATMQDCRPSSEVYSLPAFNGEFMLKEWQWVKEWVFEKWLQLNLSSQSLIELDQVYQLIVESAVQQPQVFMHRDFHSANLMLVDEPSSASTFQVGILDFQDAFIGPVTYDVVSLLRDCYIDWPNELVCEWVEYYRQLLISKNIISATETEFLKWFDWMGIQRHLKALLTFARKHVRDQQSRYLQFVPRTLAYLLSVSANYPELKPLHMFLQTQLQPACLRAIPCEP